MHPVMRVFKVFIPTFAFENIQIMHPKTTRKNTLRHINIYTAKKKNSVASQIISGPKVKGTLQDRKFESSVERVKVISSHLTLLLRSECH